MPKVLTWEERQKREKERQRKKDDRDVDRFLKAYERKKTYSQRMQEKAAWQKENTRAYQLRLTRSSGLIDVMDNIEKQTGTKPATYIRQALLEKLARDGYMPDSNKTE